MPASADVDVLDISGCDAGHAGAVNDCQGEPICRCLVAWRISVEVRDALLDRVERQHGSVAVHFNGPRVREVACIRVERPARVEEHVERSVGLTSEIGCQTGRRKRRNGRFVGSNLVARLRCSMATTLDTASPNHERARRMMSPMNSSAHCCPGLDIRQPGDPPSLSPVGDGPGGLGPLPRSR